eukprot:5257233-Pyramimonas_sp.AAC.1
MALMELNIECPPKELASGPMRGHAAMWFNGPETRPSDIQFLVVPIGSWIPPFSANLRMTPKCSKLV